MKETAVQFAKDLRLVFENTHNELDEIGIPFFYSFPKNSCQGASVYLSLFLTWIFPDASISVVKGSNRKRDEHHYWVELNNEVYDLTNDQFDDWLGERYHGLDLPVYAEKNTHCEITFSTKKESQPSMPMQRFVQFMRMLRKLIKHNGLL